MKKIAFSFVVLLMIAGGCSTKKADPLTGIENAMASHKSIHFKVTEKYAYSYTPDTTVTPYEVWAVRAGKNLRHGYVWINNYYRPYYEIYYRGNFYLTIPPKKMTILYKNFQEDLISPVDWIDIFLNPAKLKKQTTGPQRKTIIADTVYKGKTCYKISIRFQDGSKKYVYLIDKKKRVPLRAEMFLKTKDYTYNETLLFSDFSFDNVNLEKLQARQAKVLKENPVQVEGSGSETARLEKMLHKGDKAPLFSGTFYATGKPFHLSDYVGKKVVLVDFWYTHCPPCVRAMPSLSELYAQYKDKGLIVFGLNSVDNRPGSLKNLKAFLSKRKISYDIVLTKPGVDLRYKINGYPSMYVIDKQGKVAYAEIGFDRAKFEKLQAAIKALTR